MGGLGKKLLFLRKYAGLTRKYIERNYNIPSVTIRSWELLESNIGVYKLVSYLDIYKKLQINFSVNSLLDDNQELQLGDNSNLKTVHFINFDLFVNALINQPNVVLYSYLNGEVACFGRLAYKLFDLLGELGNTEGYKAISLKDLLGSQIYQEWHKEISQLKSNNHIKLKYQDLEFSILPNMDVAERVCGFVVLYEEGNNNR